MKLSVIVPCYNEEESIPLFFAEMQKVNDELPLDFEYIFINDGSKDKTLDVLRSLAKNNSNVHYISFSRNFGKEAALYAGLENATGDYVTVMDVDLQDPPELLLEMFNKIQDPDIDSVGCRRVSRTGEPPIRSFFARMFYKIINKIGQTEMVDGARDFRLMTRQMVDAILEVREYNRFSKGIFTWVGFNTIYLEYENRERVAGETSWNFWSLLKYSLEGIINFSEAPLNIATYGGMLSVFISIIGAIFIIVRTLVFGDRTSGWPSLVIIILFCSGINLLMLGIIGRYISKIFLETKSRPIYIIRETEKDLKKLTIVK
ncbi:glucosyl transferase family 2 [Floricoccus tropicus]|uniref:Glucosyl transferase family 2 n=1 Tax=Floricoccus tropicus TaxID=1859473 RepID=A0A1E8GIN6_9LACT|nr:glycosyltransferase family 2 protein [Floricoccus tropicus]OFI48134.1 glucosyl transferase family 2 [Floricoccus tropicus]